MVHIITDSSTLFTEEEAKEMARIAEEERSGKKKTGEKKDENL